MAKWERYYPYIRTDGKFYGWPVNVLIDTKAGRLRCSACKEPAPIYDITMKYCPWCGKKMTGYIKPVEPSELTTIELVKLAKEVAENKLTKCPEDEYYEVILYEINEELKMLDKEVE